MTNTIIFGYKIRERVELRRLRDPEYFQDPTLSPNTWYLRGHDLDRNAQRTFRCDRIVSVAQDAVAPALYDFTPGFEVASSSTTATPSTTSITTTWPEAEDLKRMRRVFDTYRKSLAAKPEQIDEGLKRLAERAIVTGRSATHVRTMHGDKIIIDDPVDL